MNKWGIKSAVFTYGGTAYDMASGPMGTSETKEALDVTALNQSTKQFIEGALKEIDEFTMSLYQKSSGDLTVDTTPAAASIAVTLENGVDSDATATVNFGKLIVTKVAYPNIDASGDRKAIYDVTFRPCLSAS